MPEKCFIKLKIIYNYNNNIELGMRKTAIIKSNKYEELNI